MDRRQFLIHSSFLTAGLATPLKNLWGRTTGNFTPLRRNVGYFTERGGTIGWLAADDGMVIIDSQFPETAKNCLNGLRNRSDHPLDLLINTHHHGDHTSGNPVFKGVAEKMVAHENVPMLMAQSAEEGEGNQESAYPTTTFAERWQMDVGDETVHAHHFGPAHTSGDAVIYFEKANVVHTGDLVFNRMNPYTDRPAGASIQNWIKVLQSIEEEYPADVQYIFGHGKSDFGVTGGKQDITVMRNYLAALVEHVQQGLEQGKSREEITSVEVLTGFEEFLYADFWTLPDNLNLVYEELTQS
ncbi:MBL fold metallo-hydrolase [Fodinibius salsisoli]|uniref:MBL fold metallo-hydrolase n=1 Tax=Fodinibius salsisoli TaxID=2820877 RepID=A0ABT3PMY0_9BACT|nr:MBL fold metallo-hydrolase [Fodinibius salsisoli]MCW9707143.1 MBL fold metallo-hydrolase [Fodinibius salsisoli]